MASWDSGASSDTDASRDTGASPDTDASRDTASTLADALPGDVGWHMNAAAWRVACSALAVLPAGSAKCFGASPGAVARG